MKYDGKEFTVIPGCSKYYICKDTAEVLSINKNYPYIMKPAINSTTGYSTYFMVRVVTDEGKTVKKYIHRLMAETFVANPYNKKQVNHIDGDKHNNSINNIEWISHQENGQHAYDIGLQKTVGVSQHTLDGTFIKAYKSIKEAEKATGVHNPNITKVMKGIRSTAGGFIWKPYEF